MRNSPNAVHSWPNQTKLWKQGHFEACGEEILSVKSDATQSRLNFLLHTVRFLYPRQINKLRGIIKFAKYGSFTGSVISKLENPVMLGHDDDDTRHDSYDPRKFPNMWLNSQSDFALLLVRYWICHEVSVFLWTRKFFLRSPSFILDGHATPMWSVAWYEHKKTAVT